MKIPQYGLGHCGLGKRRIRVKPLWKTYCGLWIRPLRKTTSASQPAISHDKQPTTDGDGAIGRKPISENTARRAGPVAP